MPWYVWVVIGMCWLGLIGSVFPPPRSKEDHHVEVSTIAWMLMAIWMLLYEWMKRVT